MGLTLKFLNVLLCILGLQRIQLKLMSRHPTWPGTYSQLLQSLNYIQHRNNALMSCYANQATHVHQTYLNQYLGGQSPLYSQFSRYVLNNTVLQRMPAPMVVVPMQAPVTFQVHNFCGPLPVACFPVFPQHQGNAAGSLPSASVGATSTVSVSSVDKVATTGYSGVEANATMETSCASLPLSHVIPDNSEANGSGAMPTVTASSSAMEEPSLISVTAPIPRAARDSVVPDNAVSSGSLETFRSSESRATPDCSGLSVSVTEASCSVTEDPSIITMEIPVSTTAVVPSKLGNKRCAAIIGSTFDSGLRTGSQYEVIDLIDSDESPLCQTSAVTSSCKSAAITRNKPPAAKTSDSEAVNQHEVLDLTDADDENCVQHKASTITPSPTMTSSTILPSDTFFSDSSSAVGFHFQFPDLSETPLISDIDTDDQARDDPRCLKKLLTRLNKSTPVGRPVVSATRCVQSLPKVGITVTVKSTGSACEREIVTTMSHSALLSPPAIVGTKRRKRDGQGMIWPCHRDNVSSLSPAVICDDEGSRASGGKVTRDADTEAKNPVQQQASPSRKRKRGKTSLGDKLSQVLQSGSQPRQNRTSSPFPAPGFQPLQIISNSSRREVVSSLATLPEVAAPSAQSRNHVKQLSSSSLSTKSGRFCRSRSRRAPKSRREASGVVKSLSTIDWKSLDLDRLLERHAVSQYRLQTPSSTRPADRDVLLRKFDPREPAFSSPVAFRRSTKEDVWRAFGKMMCLDSEEDNVDDIPCMKEDLEQFEQRRQLAMKLDRMMAE